MTHLKMHSMNKIDGNVSKIAALFPNCVTETKDENGEIIHKIDFDMLKQELSNTLVDGREERYQFTWPDKKQAILTANAPINKTLRPCREESVDFDNTQNLYIEGDNLEVLKLLQETYLGKIKMIYIDPPYNTGNDFVYEDDFAQNAADYIANSGQTDEDGNRLVANTESNGRFHTDWLNMMYPRLKLARDLLSDDGVIFISIDDKEEENLHKLCNEIFGESNFVGNIIWQSRTSISNDDEISTNHNHTFVYSKNRELLIFGGEDIDSDEYINPDNDPRGPWKLVPIDANHVGGDTLYPIKNPKTGIEYLPPNGRCWCYNPQTMKELMDDGRIKFGLTDDSSPKRKLFLNERLEKGDVKTPSSLLLDAGTTKTGTTEIMNLFDGEKVFDYPKPTTLILRLLKYGLLKENDIFMDFFSGSSSSAHALYNYNYLKKTKCKFIMVQIPENFDETIKTAGINARKTIKCAINFLDKIKKPHLLTEIAKERIRRAGNKLIEEHTDCKDKLDIGFRVLKIDSSNMEDVYYTPDHIDTNDLFKNNIKSDRTGEDLLFQTMLDLGIMLSSKIETKKINGKEVFCVEGNYLMACFDDSVDEKTITEIAKEKPYYFVMRDASMANDSVATNFEQIFKTYLGESYNPDNIRII